MDKPIPRNILDRLEWDTRREHKDQVKRIKPIETNCEYCGITVTDRREQIRQYTSPARHWRKRCLSCNLYWNPETEKFDLTAYDSLAFFRNYINKMDK